MSWNYRIVKYADGSGYGLHEVFYNEHGEAWSMTADPISFYSDLDEGPEGIQESLIMAVRDARGRGVLVEPDDWSTPPAPQE